MNVSDIRHKRTLEDVNWMIARYEMYLEKAHKERLPSAGAYRERLSVLYEERRTLIRGTGKGAAPEG